MLDFFGVSKAGNRLVSVGKINEKNRSFGLGHLLMQTLNGFRTIRWPHGLA